MLLLQFRMGHPKATLVALMNMKRLPEPQRGGNEPNSPLPNSVVDAGASPLVGIVAGHSCVLSTLDHQPVPRRLRLTTVTTATNTKTERVPNTAAIGTSPDCPSSVIWFTVLSGWLLLSTES
jgi:hypothetical protein